ncbi:MAG TPA: hypothetical protein VKT29_00250 [Terriglobales bacterium]|nr:hypothetical protein [Terriglobales bacterium]
MMKKLAGYVIVAMIAGTAAIAQQPPVNSLLLDHLAGNWVLRGTIAKRQTVHDVQAEWVLGHRYLRIHEVSREKNSKGQAQYEAMIFIARNETPKPHYACVWLDVYGADVAGIFWHGDAAGECASLRIQR